jgi:hypothetical protein
MPKDDVPPVPFIFPPEFELPEPDRLFVIEIGEI